MIANVIVRGVPDDEECIDPTTKEMIRPEFGLVAGQSKLLFVSPDGSKRAVHLRIGVPYESDTNEWACPCELQGFEPRYADIRGSDSLQALCLAATLIRRRVEDFIARGGRVFDPTETDAWPADAIAAIFSGIGQTD